MAVENLGKTISRIAAASFAAKQYFFAVIDSDGKAAVAGDGANAVGVIQDDVAAGEASCIMVGDGITKVAIGAAVNKGDNLASGSDGRAIVAATGDYILGQALETASTAGNIISMLFQKRGSVGL